MGAKPKTVTTIVANSKYVVLLSSCGVGLFWHDFNVAYLIGRPLVTGLTIVEIAAWLFAGVFGYVFMSLLPAVRSLEREF